MCLRSGNQFWKMVHLEMACTDLLQAGHLNGGSTATLLIEWVTGDDVADCFLAMYGLALFGCGDFGTVSYLA